jgi:hypothetical protein
LWIFQMVLVRCRRNDCCIVRVSDRSFRMYDVNEVGRFDDYDEVKHERGRLSKELENVLRERNEYKSESEQRAKILLEQAQQLAAMRQDLDELKKVSVRLADEIHRLKGELDEVKGKSSDLQHRLDVQEALVHVHDLVRMYMHYYVDPYLGGRPWREVAADLSDMVAKREDREIAQLELDRWIKQTFPHASVPITRLQKLSCSRHDITHT